MEVIEINSKEYKRIFAKPYNVYNSVDFCLLNNSKCESLKFFAFDDEGIRLGLIAGLTDDALLSPFSAPYGGLSYLDENVPLRYIDESIEAFDKHMKKCGIKKAIFTLPPPFYSPKFLNKYMFSLLKGGYAIKHRDINHSFQTKLMNGEYIQAVLWRNARKNLHIAQRVNFVFEKVGSVEEIKRAYDVIKTNRDKRGFPLRMTFEEVMKTTEVVPADVFLLKLDNVDIAAAIVFHVGEKIVQVIYWGDIPDYSRYKTMNMLSYELFDYYGRNNVDIVDIGQSTVEGVPNYGLCEFKESIGCLPTLKYTFERKFD